MATKQLQWTDIPNGDRVRFVMRQVLSGAISLRSGDMAPRYKIVLAIVIVASDYLNHHPYEDEEYIITHLVKQKQHNGITISYVRAFKRLIEETFSVNVTTDLLDDARAVAPWLKVEQNESYFATIARGHIAKLKSRSRMSKADLNYLIRKHGTNK